MATLLTAREIATEALRKIRAITPFDSGDSADITVALRWLDVVMASQTALTRCFWLIPETKTVTLVAGTGTYDLLDALGTDLPVDHYAFPVSAMLKYGTTETPLTILRADQWEEIPDKSSSGTPDRIWIDRLNEPVLKTYPVLGAGLTGYTIELRFQTFSPEYRNPNSGQEATGLRAAYQEWVIYRLAAALGDGTVRTLPAADLDRLEKKAGALWAGLMAFENREHESMPYVVSAWEPY